MKLTWCRWMNRKRCRQIRKFYFVLLTHISCLSCLINCGTRSSSCRPPLVHKLSRLQLSPCSKGLLEKLTLPQPVNKFPAFYANRRLITAFTNARFLSLSWASSFQSIVPARNPSVVSARKLLARFKKKSYHFSFFLIIFKLRARAFACVNA